MADTYQHVLEMARQYNPEDVAHMEQDAYLATTIFRLTRELHELPQEYEELLEYAALLHDIGYFYGYEAHHKHAYRMIMATDIPGLDEREKAIVANVARGMVVYPKMIARPSWGLSYAWLTVWTGVTPTPSKTWSARSLGAT